MKTECVENSLLLRMRRCLAFVVTFALFFCVVFTFADEVYANGNPYADWPPATEPARRPARRAPIRRPAPQVQEQQIVEQPQPPPPPQPSALEMGIRLMEQKRYNQANALLQRAVQEERDNPYAWYWLGRAHDSIGQFHQAQVFYRRAMELDPGFAPFSRFVTYPDHGGRIPLWDPLRPARVYPVELSNRGITIVPPDAPEAGRRPTAPPLDMNFPRLPVYVPPAPRDISIGGMGTGMEIMLETLPQFQLLPPDAVFIPEHQPVHIHIPSEPVHIPPPPPQ